MEARPPYAPRLIYVDTSFIFAPPLLLVGVIYEQVTALLGGLANFSEVSPTCISAHDVDVCNIVPLMILPWGHWQQCGRLATHDTKVGLHPY